MGHFSGGAADTRDLHNEKCVLKDAEHTTRDESYPCHNTHRLDVDGTVKKILTSDYVQEALKNWEEKRA